MLWCAIHIKAAFTPEDPFELRRSGGSQANDTICLHWHASSEALHVALRTVSSMYNLPPCQYYYSTEAVNSAVG